MIASLHGIITYKSPELKKDSYFIIDVSGVGYKVNTAVSNLKKIKEDQEVTVYTYMSVSEYAMTLYGFLNPADKTFFTLLLDVPSIGPKSAIGILEKATMAEVQQAILDNDPSVLTKMSGLGEKTAEKIIVSLKSKIESLSGMISSDSGEETKTADVDAFDALIGFGYSTVEAKKALRQIDKNIDDAGKKVREALKILGKN